MKKIVLGIATLTLATSILGACSNGETTTKAEDTKQEAKVENTKPTALSNGVQFVYNEKEVTDKDLKNHQKEYLEGVDEKYINSEFLAKNYILTQQFLKYVGTTNEEVTKEYEKSLEDTKKGLQQMHKGEFLVQYLSMKLVDKELTEDKLKSLYDGLSAKDKEGLTYESFKSNQYLVFKIAVQNNVIKPKEIEDKLLSEAKISNKELNFNHKLTENDYMPF